MPSDSSREAAVRHMKAGPGMSHVSIPPRARQRLAYMAMSALIVWHGLAMVVAASPDSAIARAARPLFGPYLTLLRLDNKWGFFAPNVDDGIQFRYVVEDASGQRHTFTPAEQLSRFHPTSLWIKDWYKTVMMFPDAHGEGAAATLCREHAALRPLSITLLEVEQKEFLPEHQLSGKHPLDPEFVTVNTLMTVRCTAMQR
jgi:hypothetical protein